MAKGKFPEIHFYVGNAENYKLFEQVDAVFSNAALHWMKHPREVIKCVWNVVNGLYAGGEYQGGTKVVDFKTRLLSPGCPNRELP